jgi:hypothetical protein
MTICARSDHGFTVYDGQEVLRVEAWGQDSARVRSALGQAVTETPGSGLIGPGTAAASVEVLTTTPGCAAATSSSRLRPVGGERIAVYLREGGGLRNLSPSGR